MPRPLLALLAGTVVLALAACGGDGSASPSLSPSPVGPFGRDIIRVAPEGGAGRPFELHVELPATNAAYALGLMGRAPLPDTEGMLFVMKAKPSCSFWMKDTPSPLSIAFIDEDGRIVGIQDMEPFSLDLIDGGRCAYALEVARGWFERQGVKTGDLIEFPWPADDPPPYPVGG